LDAWLRHDPPPTWAVLVVVERTSQVAPQITNAARVPRPRSWLNVQPSVDDLALEVLGQPLQLLPELLIGSRKPRDHRRRTYHGERPVATTEELHSQNVRLVGCQLRS